MGDPLSPPRKAPTKGHMQVSTAGKSYLPLYNDMPTMELTRPGKDRLRERIFFIDGIQTSEPKWECDTMTLRLRQTPHGIVNGELYLEMVSFDHVESSQRELDKVYPSSSIALDEIGARRLINELSAAFRMGYKVPIKQRLALVKRTEKKNDKEDQEEETQQTR